MKTKLSFIPGPVVPFPPVRNLDTWTRPYFRSQDFSNIVLDIRSRIFNLFGAPSGSELVILASSGTGGLEAAVVNFSHAAQGAVVVEAGGFGRRIGEIYECTGYSYNIHRVEYRSDLVLSALEIDASDDLYINAHETTTGMLFDIDAIGKFLKNRSDQGLFIVDGISMYLTDPIDMAESAIDALVLGSQKAFGLNAGMALVILSPRAIERIVRSGSSPRSFYFDFRKYLRDIPRGQTPFTPPIETILQLQIVLHYIDEMGPKKFIQNAARNANRFRTGIKASEFGLEPFSPRMPNAMTACYVTGQKRADHIVRILSDEYGIDVAPNGGDLSSSVFRVAHMGFQTERNIDQLLDAIREVVS